jgi:hypothetical protein
MVCGARQAQSGAGLLPSRGLGVARMRTRQWRRRFGAVAAGALLTGPAMASASAAIAAPVHAVAAAAAHKESIVTAGRATKGRGHQQSLPDTGFDGMEVAAIGTGFAGGGWLLMFVGSRQLRRRSR